MKIQMYADGTLYHTGLMCCVDCAPENGKRITLKSCDYNYLRIPGTELSKKYSEPVEFARDCAAVEKIALDFVIAHNRAVEDRQAAIDRQNEIFRGSELVALEKAGKLYARDDAGKFASL